MDLLPLGPENVSMIVDHLPPAQYANLYCQALACRAAESQSDGDQATDDNENLAWLQSFQFTYNDPPLWQQRLQTVYGYFLPAWLQPLSVGDPLPSWLVYLRLVARWELRGWLEFIENTGSSGSLAYLQAILLDTHALRRHLKRAHARGDFEPVATDLTALTHEELQKEMDIYLKRQLAGHIPTVPSRRHHAMWIRDERFDTSSAGVILNGRYLVYNCKTGGDVILCDLAAGLSQTHHIGDDYNATSKVALSSSVLTAVSARYLHIISLSNKHTSQITPPGTLLHTPSMVSCVRTSVGYTSVWPLPGGTILALACTGSIVGLLIDELDRRCLYFYSHHDNSTRVAHLPRQRGQPSEVHGLLLDLSAQGLCTFVFTHFERPSNFNRWFRSPIRHFRATRIDPHGHVSENDQVLPDYAPRPLPRTYWRPTYPQPAGISVRSTGTNDEWLVVVRNSGMQSAFTIVLSHHDGDQQPFGDSLHVRGMSKHYTDAVWKGRTKSIRLFGSLRSPPDQGTRVMYSIHPNQRRGGILGELAVNDHFAVQVWPKSPANPTPAIMVYGFGRSLPAAMQHT